MHETVRNHIFDNFWLFLVTWPCDFLALKLSNSNRSLSPSYLSRDWLIWGAWLPSNLSLVRSLIIAGVEEWMSDGEGWKSGGWGCQSSQTTLLDGMERVVVRCWPSWPWEWRARYLINRCGVSLLCRPNAMVDGHGIITSFLNQQIILWQKSERNWNYQWICGILFE